MPLTPSSFSLKNPPGDLFSCWWLESFEKKIAFCSNELQTSKNQDIPFLDLLHKKRALFLVVQSVNPEF